VEGDGDECKACHGSGKETPIEQTELGHQKGNKNGLYSSTRTADEDDDEDDESTLEEDQAHRENDDPSQAERNDRDNQRDREREKEGSIKQADEGNTGLSGPSPKMDKKRWTPENVKPIDVPSEHHPTIQKDITEVMPKDNLTGPTHDIEEINAQTTTETLPTATDYDGGGFATGGEEFGPNTKTFPKGDQASPVTKQTVEE
jgi:hypothetical protein